MITTRKGDGASLTLGKKPLLALVQNELLSRLSVWSKSSMYTTVTVKRKCRLLLDMDILLSEKQTP